jgi:hypothetical protein
VSRRSTPSNRSEYFLHLREILCSYLQQCASKQSQGRKILGMGQKASTTIEGAAKCCERTCAAHATSLFGTHQTKGKHNHPHSLDLLQRLSIGVVALISLAPMIDAVRRRRNRRAHATLKREARWTVHTLVSAPRRSHLSKYPAFIEQLL